MADPVRILRFASQQEVRAEDVVGLWLRETGLTLEEALRRVREVLFVAVADGAPVGVCTAYLRDDAQLRLPVWCFRAFVAEAHRHREIGLRLLTATQRELAARHADGTDRRAAGIVLEIENEGLKRAFPQGRVAQADLTFVGVNAFGDHLRVHYFPGATVQGST